jgi:hypothetical protein
MGQTWLRLWYHFFLKLVGIGVISEIIKLLYIYIAEREIKGLG